MFDLNPPPFLDNPVSFSLKLNHRRQVSGDGVGGPHICVYNSVKWPTKLFYGTKASERILVS